MKKIFLFFGALFAVTAGVRAQDVMTYTDGVFNYSYTDSDIKTTGSTVSNVSVDIVTSNVQSGEIGVETVSEVTGENVVRIVKLKITGLVDNEVSSIAIPESKDMPWNNAYSQTSEKINVLDFSAYDEEDWFYTVNTSSPLYVAYAQYAEQAATNAVFTRFYSIKKGSELIESGWVNNNGELNDVVDDKINADLYYYCYDMVKGTKASHNATLIQIISAKYIETENYTNCVTSYVPTTFKEGALKDAKNLENIKSNNANFEVVDGDYLYNASKTVLYAVAADVTSGEINLVGKTLYDYALENCTGVTVQYDKEAPAHIGVGNTIVDVRVAPEVMVDMTISDQRIGYAVSGVVNANNIDMIYGLMDPDKAVYVDFRNATVNGALNVKPATGFNPNCLFYFADGTQGVTGTNVVVGKKCANLVVEDAKPFYNKVAFTADDASYERSVAADTWTTFVIPFETTAPEYTTSLASFDPETFVLKTTKTDYIRANTPYLFHNIYEDIAGISGTNCSVPVTGSTVKALADGTAKFVGVYEQTSISSDSYNNIGVSSNGQFKWFKTGNVKSCHAYFEMSVSKPAKVKSCIKILDAEGEVIDTLNLDEVETAIDEIEVDSPVLDNRVYNLNGAVVGNTTSNLKKGIYIVNGKKVVKK